MTGSPSDTGLMDDKQSRQHSTSYGTSETSQQARASTSNSSTPTSPPQPSQRSGSAWERLRQNAMSNGQTSSSTQSSRSYTGSNSQSRSSGSDSFAFSLTDENKQLAQGEAQNAFNARIERERQGKDLMRGGKVGEAEFFPNCPTNFNGSDNRMDGSVKISLRIPNLKNSEHSTNMTTSSYANLPPLETQLHTFLGLRRIA